MINVQKKIEFLPDFLQKVIGMKTKRRKEGKKMEEEKKDGRTKEGKKEVQKI